MPTEEVPHKNCLNWRTANFGRGPTTVMSAANQGGSRMEWEGWCKQRAADEDAAS